MNPFQSHSQAGQDRFAHELIGDAGTFLDVGANHPIKLSNTYALEQLGWTGILVENDPALIPMLRAERRAFLIWEDATTIDWRYHRGDGPMDYLSLDVDHPSPIVLGNLLRAGARFKVITAEHDGYRFGFDRRDDMVKELQDAGYDVLCADVCSEGCDFEIWAVDPRLVDMTKAERFRSSGPIDWREFWSDQASDHPKPRI